MQEVWGTKGVIKAGVCGLNVIFRERRERKKTHKTDSFDKDGRLARASDRSLFRYGVNICVFLRPNTAVICVPIIIFFCTK